MTATEVDRQAEDRPANDLDAPKFPGFWVVFGIAVVLIAAAYSNAVQGAFVYDDEWQIVRNPLIQNPALYRTALTSDVWAFRGGGGSTVSNYYRPVFTAWSIVNFKLFQLEPKGWHIGNIALHILACYLALLLLMRSGLSPPACAIGTWVFAVHPVHVESVTWIAGSPDLLMAVFLLGSTLIWMKASATRKLYQWALALVLFLLALGSKEASIAFVPFIFLFSWVMGKNEARAWRGALVTALPFLAVGIGFFVIRAIVMKGAGIGAQNPAGIGSMLLSAPEVLWFYIRQSFLPFELSSAYALRTVTSGNLGLTNFYLPLVGLVLLMPLGIWLARRSKASATGLALFVLFLLPAFYIRAFHPEHIVRDRYLYLPLLGILMLLLGALEPLIARNRSLSWGIGAVLAAVLSLLTWRYNEVWRDDVTLWTAGVRTDPRGAMAHMQLAEALRTSGKPKEALPWVEAAIAINPGFPRPHTILGLTHKDLGNQSLSIEAFEKALSFGFDTLIAAENLAGILQRQGELDKAIEVLDSEIVRNPSSRAVCVRNIAVILVQQGKRDEALARLEGIRPELEAHPSPRAVAAWYFMAELYLEKFENEKAIGAYRAFLRDSAGSSDPQTRGFRQLARQMLLNLGQDP